MKQNHPRQLLPISPEWDIAQLSQALLRALDGSGPALSAGATSTSQVAADIAIVVPTSGSSGQHWSTAGISQILTRISWCQTWPKLVALTSHQSHRRNKCPCTCDGTRYSGHRSSK